SRLRSARRGETAECGTRSSLDPRQEAERLALDLFGGRAADPVVLDPLLLAVAHDLVRDVHAREPAAARGAPVDRDLVPRDDAAPGAVLQEVVERRASGAHALARQRLARVGVEQDRDHPRLHVIVLLVAGPVEGADL